MERRKHTLLEFISVSHLVYNSELHPEPEIKWRVTKIELPPPRVVKSLQDYTQH